MDALTLIHQPVKLEHSEVWANVIKKQIPNHKRIDAYKVAMRLTAPEVSTNGNIPCIRFLPSTHNWLVVMNSICTFSASCLWWSIILTSVVTPCNQLWILSVFSRWCNVNTASHRQVGASASCPYLHLSGGPFQTKQGAVWCYVKPSGQTLLSRLEKTGQSLFWEVILHREVIQQTSPSALTLDPGLITPAEDFGSQNSPMPFLFLELA